jgi:uncharacterized protein (TIGR00730 family)
VEKTVTIFGSGHSKPGEPVYEMAEEIGGLLARASITIVNGGYGGTMLAAAQRAAQAGGKVIGVTCSAFKKGKPNKYLSSQITTANLDERLNKLLEMGDHYIVLPGGTGTLLELAKIWELKNKGFLNLDKKIILVGDFWQPLVKLMAKDDPSSEKQLLQANSPKQAVELIGK